jgi:hypothetical protein
MNPDILNKYATNRLRVVGQLRYSPHNENAIDLGLFIDERHSRCHGGTENRFYPVGWHSSGPGTEL